MPSWPSAGQHAVDGGVFHEFRVAYSARIADVPASTGYGEPIQRLFKFREASGSSRRSASTRA